RLAELTIMVNTPNVWLLKDLISPPKLDDSNRRIKGGPVYDLDEVKTAINQHGFFIINEVAQQDVIHRFNVPFDDNEIKAILLALRKDLYQNSEWTDTTPKMILPCDHYLIRVNRARLTEWEH